MSFVVAADSYDRFMGRYSRLLAPIFADFAGVRPPREVLEVGCGPGALTNELVERLGSGSVNAVDPSPPFVAAARERLPGVDVRHASAEELPFEDDRFDTAVAQLVVHHMSDAIAGLAEMGRVTATNGTVAACVWDFEGERTPLSPFWKAVKDFDATAVDESDLPGARKGHLVELFRSAGLSDPVEEALSYEVEHSSFDEWWEPFLLGVGPAGKYVAGLAADERQALADRCRQILPPAPFTQAVAVWAVRAAAP